MRVVCCSRVHKERAGEKPNRIKFCLLKSARRRTSAVQPKRYKHLAVVSCHASLFADASRMALSPCIVLAALAVALAHLGAVVTGQGTNGNQPAVLACPLTPDVLAQVDYTNVKAACGVRSRIDLLALVGLPHLPQWHAGLALLKMSCWPPPPPARTPNLRIVRVMHVASLQ